MVLFERGFRVSITCFRSFCVTLTSILPNPLWGLLPALTKEMDHKAVAVAVDVGGGVRLELDGDVCRGRVELEAGPRAPVLTQDLCRQVVSIVEGHHVILPYVKPRERSTQGTRSIAIAIYTVETVKR